MKKGLRVVNNIVLIFLLILLIYICYSKFIKKDDMITLFGRGFLVVVTESMEPTIESRRIYFDKRKK